MLWLLLAPLLPDLIDEDATPKVGPVQPRADIGIPSLRLIVEAKFMRVDDPPKKMVEQIAEDASLYLVAGSKYDRLDSRSSGTTPDVPSITKRWSAACDRSPVLTMQSSCRDRVRWSRHERPGENLQADREEKQREEKDEYLNAPFMQAILGLWCGSRLLSSWSKKPLIPTKAPTCIDSPR